MMLLSASSGRAAEPKCNTRVSVGGPMGREVRHGGRAVENGAPLE